jgi:hypothetical protein
MCVINYLVSKNAPGLEEVFPRGVDSIGIKWRDGQEAIRVLAANPEETTREKTGDTPALSRR